MRDVDVKIQEILKTDKPSAYEVFNILTPEKQREIIDNEWVLFYGTFGWATCSESRIGTATCIGLKDIRRR